MIIWQFITITLVKIVIRSLRLVGRHGTALPGLIAESMYPRLLQRLAADINGGVILVTGTNGKTTTAKMLRGLLEGRGHRVLANRSGSNFTRGILSSVVDHTSAFGKLPFDIAVLEVDEAYCRLVARQVKPRCVVVLNVMRDQLDRYGEIDTTAKLIGEALAYTNGAVLNSDDPPVAVLNKRLSDEKNTTYYGVSSQLRNQLPSDEELLTGSAQRTKKVAKPDLALIDFQPEKDNRLSFEVDGSTFDMNLKFSGIHNAQNAAAALATVRHIEGNVLDADLKTLSSIGPAFGRGEVVDIKGVLTQLALIKNPSGFNQNIRAYASNKNVGSILILINDKYADSRDVSWLWDVNISDLLPSKAKFTTGGIRAYDMALRLQYEDLEVKQVDISIKAALRSAVEATPKGKELLILPTYTAMLEVRRLLSKEAELEKIWR